MNIIEFEDIKPKIDLKQYSNKTISTIKDLFNDAGIIYYINNRKGYDDCLKEEIIKYFMMQFLDYVKTKHKKISIKNLNNCDSWFISKIMELAKYEKQRKEFSFIIDGVIKNIYIDHKDEIFYNRTLDIFSEYCIYYDILDTAFIMYPEPYNFARDFTNIFQSYFNFIQNQIEKNSLNDIYTSNMIYAFACSDVYFPLLKEQVEYKVNHTQLPIPNKTVHILKVEEIDDDDDNDRL